MFVACFIQEVSEIYMPPYGHQISPYGYTTNYNWCIRPTAVAQFYVLNRTRCYNLKKFSTAVALTTLEKLFLGGLTCSRTSEEKKHNQIFTPVWHTISSVPLSIRHIHQPYTAYCKNSMSSVIVCNSEHTKVPQVSISSQYSLSSPPSW